MRAAYTRLNRRQRYLQVALNSTLSEAKKIISALPVSERIIIEAGTPLIKRYGMEAVSSLRQWWQNRLNGATESENTLDFELPAQPDLNDIIRLLREAKTKKVYRSAEKSNTDMALPYIVADLKTMDRGAAEVALCAEAGASAAVALGSAPVETLNIFIEACNDKGIDAMIDMMNVEYPTSILKSLKKMPHVVILHRGVDEEAYNKEKPLPLHEIRRIKGTADLMIAIAGGDTIREVERAIFNDADIVVIWKSVYQSSAETITLVEQFLKNIK